MHERADHVTFFTCISQAAVREFETLSFKERHPRIYAHKLKQAETKLKISLEPLS